MESPTRHDNVAQCSSPGLAVESKPELAKADFAEREVLTVDEVAEVLRMEERLVYGSIKRDEIPGVRRFGKRGIIRISRRVFFDWLHRGAL